MNKKIVLSIILVLLLAGCAANSGDKDNSDTTATSIVTGSIDTTIDSSYTEKEPVTLYIPPIPETGIPEIPDAEVIYSDTEVAIVVSPEGTTYANGNPVSPNYAADIIVEQLNPNKTTTTTSFTPYTPDNHPALTSPNNNQAASTTNNTGTVSNKNPEVTTTKKAETTTSKSPVTTTSKNPSVTTTKSAVADTEPEAPGNNNETSETIANGTYYIDNGDGPREEGKNYLELPTLAKYVDTGDTDLAIYDIKVFSNSRPGVAGLQSFKPGDTLIINVLCNIDARLESEMYVVREGTQNKSSYSKNEYIAKSELYTSFPSSENQLSFELKLPDKVNSAVYEFRFICGGEEGFIRFHIG